MRQPWRDRSAGLPRGNRVRHHSKSSSLPEQPSAAESRARVACPAFTGDSKAFLSSPVPLPQTLDRSADLQVELLADAPMSHSCVVERVAPQSRLPLLYFARSSIASGDSEAFLLFVLPTDRSADLRVELLADVLMSRSCRVERISLLQAGSADAGDIQPGGPPAAAQVQGGRELPGRRPRDDARAGVPGCRGALSGHLRA